jgi:hypothetical protein
MVTCHDPSFQHELWRMPRQDWPDLYPIDRNLWITSSPHAILVDVDSGTVIRAMSYSGSVMTAAAEWLCTYDNQTKHSQILSSDGAVRWRGPLVSSMVFNDRFVCFSHDVGRKVTCIAQDSWEELWTWSVPQTGGEVRQVAAGFPGIALLGSRVLLTTTDMEIVELEATTGEQVHVCTVRPGGGFFVTDTQFVFWNGVSLTSVDHSSWRTSVEDRPDLSQLYGRHPPTANAFTMSTRALVWTTMHGALMATSLDRSSPREVWEVTIPGAIMPISVPPLLCGRHMYYTARGGHYRLDVYVGA